MSLICSFQIPGEPTGKGRPRMTTRGGKVRFGIDILCRFHMLRKARSRVLLKSNPAALRVLWLSANQDSQCGARQGFLGECEMQFKEECVGRLSEAIRYDPQSGKLFWKHRDSVPSSTNARWVGKEAGTVKPCGYIRIAFDRSHYYAHRVAWALHYGEWPPGEIDHINGDRGDNRIENLRIATRQQNTMNHGPSTRNTSGVAGVAYHAVNRKWVASLTIDRKRIYLGSFKNINDAIAARKRAEVEHYGEFSRKVAS